MKLKDTCYLEENGGNFVIFPLPKSIDNTDTIITLDEAGVLLWQALQKETAESELVAVLMSHYEVDEATAIRYVKIFVCELVDSKLIENFP
ncbi:MAG: PqqD family protein [Ruminococcus sp.]|nr:PqqD family protein [Ruminococcus sp.]